MIETKNNAFVLQRKHIFWSAFFGLVFFLIAQVKEILTPFLVSFVVTLLFHKVVDRLEQKKIPRYISSFFVVLLVFGVCFYLLFITIPFIHWTFVEFLKLIEKISLGGVENLNNIKYINKITSFLEITTIDLTNHIIKDYSKDIILWSKSVLGNVINSSFHLFTILGLFCLSPIITFLMLKDLNSFTKNFYDAIPKRYLTDCKNLIQEINNTVFRYIEGQFIVSIFLTFFYGFLLAMLKVKNAFLIGALVGFTSYIPYIGFYFSAFVSLVIVYNQFHTIYNVVLTLVVLLVGQAIEGNFITPKIIGDKIGLHPNWVIFGMLACVPIFGAIGIAFAVPLTATIGVVIKYFYRKYKTSSLYND